MAYPKDIYKRIKPVMSKDDALKKAEAAKPRYRHEYINVTGGPISKVIEKLEAYRAEYGDVKIVANYYGYYRISIKTQIPVKEIAADILSKDRTRYNTAKRNAEYRYDEKIYNERVDAKRASSGCKSKCCCCGKSV